MSAASHLSLGGVLLTLSALVPAVLAGALVCRFILREPLRVGLSRGIGVSFGLGSGLLAWCMMVLLLAGIRLTPVRVLGFVACCLVILWLVGRALPEPAAQSEDSREPALPAWRRALTWLLALVLASQFALLLAMTVLVDIIHYDTLNVWAPRALGIFVQQTFFAWPATVHGEQPQLVPLVFAWMYGWHGRVADEYVKIVSAMFVFAATLASYWALRRRRVPADVALAWCCFGVLAGSWWFSGGCHAYADVPLSVFLVVGVVMADEWAWTASWRSLAVAGIAGGLAAFTKLEGNGAWLVILAVSCLGVRMAKARGAHGRRVGLTVVVTLVGLWLLTAGLWYGAEARYGTESYGPQAHFSQLPQLRRLPVILHEAWLTVSPIARAGSRGISGALLGASWFGTLVVLLAVPFLLVPDAVRRTRAHLLALAIVALIAISLSPYFSTTYPVRVCVYQAFNRQISQIQPLLIVFFGLFFWRWLRGEGWIDPYAPGPQASGQRSAAAGGQQEGGQSG
jgi:hypothetical protein